MKIKEIVDIDLIKIDRASKKGVDFLHIHTKTETGRSATFYYELDRRGRRDNCRTYFKYLDLEYLEEKDHNLTWTWITDKNSPDYMKNKFEPTKIFYYIYIYRNFYRDALKDLGSHANEVMIAAETIYNSERIQSILKKHDLDFNFWEIRPWKD